MKKIFFTVLLVGFAVAGNAQTVTGLGDTGSLIFRKSPDFNDANVQGSKYFSEDFKQAKVNKGTQDFSIRYNAYSDVMEYKNGNETLELIKDQNTYFQFANGDVFELMSYEVKGNTVSRYNQILLDKDNVKVSKFKSIKLIEAKAPANSYDSATPASYKPNKDEYFITYNDQTFEFDGKQKTLSKMIPAKLAEIKKFYKENKIKENDADMIKLGNFLSTL